MADRTANGAELLVARILDDAGSDAGRTAEEAAAEVNRLNELADFDVFEIENAAASRCAAVKAEALERAAITAKLEARKDALGARRELLSRAFSEAYKRLLSISGDKRDGLLIKMAVSEAAGGETVMCASCDEANMKRLLPEINSQLGSAGKAPLVMGGVNSAADAGFVLAGDGYDITCTFESLIADAAESCEAEAAAILFS